MNKFSKFSITPSRKLDWEFVGGIRRLFAASTNGSSPMVDALSLIPPTNYLKHSTLLLEINALVKNR